MNLIHSYAASKTGNFLICEFIGASFDSGNIYGLIYLLYRCELTPKEGAADLPQLLAFFIHI